MHNLSEIVIEGKLASADEVRRAASLGRGREALIVTLIRELKIDDYALAEAIAKQTRHIVADPLALRIDERLLRVVPRALCNRQKFIPLNTSGAEPETTLFIAMADPTDAVAIAEIERETGHRVVADRVLSVSAIDTVLARHYRGVVTEVMPRSPQQGEPAHVASVEARLDALIDVLERRGLIEAGEVAAALSIRLTQHDRGE